MNDCIYSPVSKRVIFETVSQCWNCCPATSTKSLLRLRSAPTTIHRRRRGAVRKSRRCRIQTSLLRSCYRQCAACRACAAPRLDPSEQCHRSFLYGSPAPCSERRHTRPRLQAAPPSRSCPERPEHTARSPYVSRQVRSRDARRMMYIVCAAQPLHRRPVLPVERIDEVCCNCLDNWEVRHAATLKVGRPAPSATSVRCCLQKFSSVSFRNDGILGNWASASRATTPCAWPLRWLYSSSMPTPSGNWATPSITSRSKSSF